NLSGGSGATVSMGQATGTIVNDDSMPSVSIGGGVSHAEGNGGTTNFDFAVTLSGPSGQTVTVGYQTADGTATAGSDYTAASGTLTFAPGETAKTVTVQVTGDTTAEDDETFTVELSGATGAMLSTAQATGTIHNDDSAPTLSISGVTHAEGNGGTTNFDFTVSLSAASGQTVTVDWSTADGTADSMSDYTWGSGTLTFSPGETAKTVTVSVTGDTTYEPNETFTVSLSNSSNASVSVSQATGTITNDDSMPSVSISGVSQSEGDGGTTPFDFTVSLSQASGQTVTVNWATADGTASAGTDYASGSGTLTFAPGETSQAITVGVNGDTAYEPNETFTVNLSGPSGASVSVGQATGTIVNDDSVPSVSLFGGVSQSEGNSGATNFDFVVSLSDASGQTATVNWSTADGTVVSLSDASGQTATVNWSTADGTAVAGSDYTSASGTLTFAPGETVKTVTVQVTGDTAYEDDETFTVNLSGGSGATVSMGQATGTIVNDDSMPSVSIGGGVSHAEGNGGTTNFDFAV
ncbi:MAG: hypothetical protein J0I06_00020, partial [Planctomycetes bacterium]|nr:hypothetical protein [Planctomycetota bacterium]